MNTSPNPSEISDTLAEEAATWLVRLGDGGLSARELAAFEQWFNTSPQHQQAFEAFRGFWDSPQLRQVLAEYPLAEGQPPPAEVTGKGLGRLKPRLSQTSRRRRTSRLAWAAGFMVLVLGVFLRTANLACLESDYCTAVGEVRTFALADGSEVTLNTDSALKLHRAEGLRWVRLVRGEAFFDVRRDPARPFLVDARHSQTRVKGTRFVVREDAAADTVTVQSGVVEVSRPEGSKVVLRDNEQVHVAAGQALTVEKTHAQPSWTKGRLLFDDAPLAEVVAEIGRYRRGALVIRGTGLGSLRVSGRFDISDTDRALESLAQTLPIKIYHITPWLVVIA